MDFDCDSHTNFSSSPLSSSVCDNNHSNGRSIAATKSPLTQSAQYPWGDPISTEIDGASHSNGNAFVDFSGITDDYFLVHSSSSNNPPNHHHHHYNHAVSSAISTMSVSPHATASSATVPLNTSSLVASSSGSAAMSGGFDFGCGDDKLERSRQSARDCRARKRLKYQYLDGMIHQEEESILKMSSMVDEIRGWVDSFDHEERVTQELGSFIECSNGGGGEHKKPNHTTNNDNNNDDDDSCSNSGGGVRYGGSNISGVSANRRMMSSRSESPRMNDFEEILQRSLIDEEGLYHRQQWTNGGGDYYF